MEEFVEEWSDGLAGWAVGGCPVGYEGLAGGGGEEDCFVEFGWVADGCVDAVAGGGEAGRCGR